jgi:hypothetical protein
LSFGASTKGRLALRILLIENFGRKWPPPPEVFDKQLIEKRKLQDAPAAITVNARGGRMVNKAFIG